MELALEPANWALACLVELALELQGTPPLHPIDAPTAQPCALGEMSPPHHPVLVMAGLGRLEQGHARSVTIVAAQSSQGGLAESLACRVFYIAS